MRTDRQAVLWAVAFAALLLGVYVLKDVLLPFVVGMIIAYALNPVTERLVRMGLSRTAASATVVALILVVAGLILYFLVPPLVAQLQLLAENMPALAARTRTLIEEVARERLGPRYGEAMAGVDRALAGLEIDWSAIAPKIAQTVWSKGLALANIVSLLLVTPLVVFYLLVDWRTMLAKVESWLPRDSAPTITRVAGEIDDAIAAFIRGQGMVCLILGLLYAVGLTWAGLRYGLLIGLATGLLSFVPFVGWALGLIVSVVAILAQSWPDLVPMYKVIGVFLAGQALDSALLSPRIVGSRVGLHPLWLIFALFVFSYVFGFIGVLIAVPLGAAAAVIVRHGLRSWLASDVYKGRGQAEAGATTLPSPPAQAQTTAAKP